MRTKKGFTLVELLVVISIIGVLVALITPAIFFAQKRALVVRDVLEVTGMSQALEKYRTDYGVYPPDLSSTDPTQDAIAIDRHLGRNFRARALDPLFEGGRLNGTPLGASGVPAEIDPAEALVLWLSGFSADPRRPLNGAKPAPIFEFDQSRLRDADGDGYFTYFPKGDKSETPYVYYGSTTTDGATAYNATAAAVVVINNSGGIQVAGGARKKIPVPYGKSLNGGVVYANAGKFQIVSAGADGQYVDDSYNAAQVMANPRAYNQNPMSKTEKDNLSSFCENGAFQDALDD